MVGFLGSRFLFNFLRLGLLVSWRSVRLWNIGLCRCRFLSSFFLVGLYRRLCLAFQALFAIFSVLEFCNISAAAVL